MFSHLEGQGKESMYIQKYSQCFSNIRIFVTVNIELCRGKHIQQAHCLTDIPVFFFSTHIGCQATAILTTFLWRSLMLLPLKAPH